MAAVDLVTGALVLLAATAALAGPVAAAMLMHRHGVVLGATAPAWGGGGGGGAAGGGEGLGGGVGGGGVGGGPAGWCPDQRH
ncbi:hypothetical protein [Nocardia cyriacigeorgica]|uniref:hypothetical protein n=1 Tax=Nocardia cyriacigeorgica TaxID=135487 RepID=UPI002455B3AE|nr:hypothetical protein [Nocardia cyriacigeorgica]